MKTRFSTAMNFLKTTLALLVACGLAVSAMAQAPNSVYFDFGRHDGGVNGRPVPNPTTPLGGTGLYYWNSIGSSLQGQSAADLYTGLVTANNTPLSGWVVDIEGANNQANGFLNGGLSLDASTQNPTYALLGDFAVKDATGDYFFTTTSAQFILKGLNPTYTYDFTFFGSRLWTVGGTRTTTYTAAGLTTSTTSPLATTGVGIGAGGYNANNNTTVSLLGVKPNALGNITFTYTAASGGFGYLNAMKVTFVPEPSTLALLALGGIAAVAMRRRS
jgi:hypothetical protein